MNGVLIAKWVLNLKKAKTVMQISILALTNCIVIETQEDHAKEWQMRNPNLDSHPLVERRWNVLCAGSCSYAPS